MAAPTAEPTSPAVSDRILSNRWTILFFSVLSMVAVANFQYGWTLFVAKGGWWTSSGPGSW